MTCLVDIAKAQIPNDTGLATTMTYHHPVDKPGFWDVTTDLNSEECTYADPQPFYFLHKFSTFHCGHNRGSSRIHA